MALEDTPRWSGYDSQSKAWQEGYDWAHTRGPHSALGYFEAVEAYGYDFDSKEDRDFDAGVEFAFAEQDGE